MWLSTDTGDGVKDQMVIYVVMTFTTRLHSARWSTLTPAVASSSSSCIRHWWHRITHMSSIRSRASSAARRVATTPGQGARTVRPAPFTIKSVTATRRGTAGMTAIQLVVGSSTSTRRQSAASPLAVGHLSRPPSTTRTYHQGRLKLTFRRWLPGTSCSTPEESEPVLRALSELLISDSSLQKLILYSS